MIKMYESGLQRLYDSKKELKIRQAIDSEMEREIISLKKRRIDEQEKRLLKMEELSYGYRDRIEDIRDGIRVKISRMVKYENEMWGQDRWNRQR